MALNKILRGALAAFAVLSISTVAMADSLETNKVVYDKNGNPVLSIMTKNCVITRWDGQGVNPCAPVVEEVVAEKPKPRPLPTPARMLKKADRTIYFGFDNSGLMGSEKAKLDNLIEALKDSSDVKSADIVGYADRMGKSAYNVSLSERRAANVQNYINSRGFLNTNVTEVRGLGETSAFSTCEDSLSRKAKIDCLQPDRRVEVEVKFYSK